MADVQVGSKSTNYATDYVRGDWDKAQYLPNAHVDNLMAAVLNLGAEFWAMRRRQMVIEKLLEQNKIVDRAAIEAYRPTEAEKAAWNIARDDMIERTFAVLARSPMKVGGVPPQAKVPALGPR